MVVQNNNNNFSIHYKLIFTPKMEAALFLKRQKNLLSYMV